MISEQVFSLIRYEDLALKADAEIITIGYSEQNRPIQVLKKGSGKLKVLFVARIHGSEPATTEALIDFFKENTFKNITLYGIFMANPDGAALYEYLWQQNPEANWKNNFNDARLNANKVDINRDWFDLSQKETKAIQKFLISLRPDFAVDFHEFYWSDKGYPPKRPTDDEDGFMATMTDAPFFGVNNFVEAASEQAMNYVKNKLESEFDWNIKTRHFMGEKKDNYETPIFLGIYLPLRGIPKLLIETWGVACSTLLLNERISFHKRAMQHLIDWLEINQQKLYLQNESVKLVELSFSTNDLQKKNIFINTLEKHGLKNKTINEDDIVVSCTSIETGFVNTIYYLIFENENLNAIA